MLRNLFTLFATLSVGVTTASASVPAATDQSMDQRLLNAQKQIEMIMSGQETAKPPEATQAAWNNWHNWHNNYCRYNCPVPPPPPGSTLPDCRGGHVGPNGVLIQCK
jgi:hypothetical protein